MVIAIGPTMQRERGLLLEGCDCPVQDPLAVTIPGRDLGALLSKRLTGRLRSMLVIGG